MLTIMECEACGAFFGAPLTSDLCPTCRRALDSVFPGVEYARLRELVQADRQQNAPLTIEDLRKMDGEPVYVVPTDRFSEYGKWCIVSVDDNDDYSWALVPGIDCWSWKFRNYGEQWLAYRHKPEGGAEDE